MTESTRHEATIESLALDLEPVRRLPPPVVRAAMWIGLAVAFGVALTPFSDAAGMLRRLASEPDMWLAGAGSALTAAAAAWAAFATAVPGSSRHWPLLPIPPLLVWICASGWGCLRNELAPETTVAALAETRNCLVFIIGLSVPLSAVLLMMMRQAFSLRPGVTAALAGLAAAAASATLLNLIHPYDAAVTDLAVHAAATAAVVGAVRAIGPRVAGATAAA